MARFVLLMSCTIRVDIYQPGKLCQIILLIQKTETLHSAV